jgi:hypothetical protein
MGDTSVNFGVSGDQPNTEFEIANVANVLLKLSTVLSEPVQLQRIRTNT